MGELVVTIKEMQDTISEAIDKLDGKLYKEDFTKACKEVEKEYSRFSDKK